MVDDDELMRLNVDVDWESGSKQHSKWANVARRVSTYDLCAVV